MQAYPHNLEREYARAIIAVMSDAHARVMRLYPRTDGVRQDAGEATIGRELEGIRVDTFRIISRKRAGLVAQGIGKRVHRFTDDAIGAQVKAVIGINPLAGAPPTDPVSILNPWVADNVALIRTVPERYFTQVQSIVSESVVIGRRADKVRELLQERFDVSKTNAIRIARDQISKLTGAITEVRQRSLGIDAYIWRTSNDERVRESHALNEGERFLWNEPPAETGHPGEDIQCRCRAEPDLSALLR